MKFTAIQSDSSHFLIARASVSLALAYHLKAMAFLPPSFQNPLWQSMGYGINAMMLIALVLFGLGIKTRATALAIWFILALFFSLHRPAVEIHTSFLSLIMLFNVFVTSPPKIEERENQIFIFALMSLYGLSYSLSGVFKLLSPEWMNGNNMQVFFLSSHSDWVRAFSQSFSPSFVTGLSWFVAVVEGLVLPGIYWSRTRRYAMLVMIAMHIAIALISNFFHVSIGMIACNLFCYPYFSRFQFRLAIQKN